MNALNLDDALQLARNIASCDKSPRQKIEELRNRIYPLIRQQYQFGIPNWPEIQNISLQFDEIVKEALGLPRNSHSAYLYSPRESGCIGLQSIEDYVKVLTLSNFLKIIWSYEDNEQEGQTRHYFDETPETASIPDHWNDRTRYSNKEHVRNVSRGIFWIFEIDWMDNRDQTPVLKTEIFKSFKMKIFGKEHADRIEELLGEKIQTAIYHKWTSDWKTGAEDVSGYVRSAATCPEVSTFYLNAGHVSLSPLDETFIHQAKTGTTELPDDPIPAKKRGSFISCTDCEDGYEKKSLTHVVSMCNMDLRTERHDSIVQLLVEAIRKGSKASYDVKLDLVVEEAENLQRPDLVIRGQIDQKDEIIVLDVTCPLEYHPHQLNKAHTTKKTKYAYLKQKLKDKNPEARVRLRSFVVGALGSWRKENWKTLTILGVPPEIQLRLAQLTAKSAISWSRFIYEEALSGYKGTSTRPDNCLEEL